MIQGGGRRMVSFVHPKSAEEKDKKAAESEEVLSGV
jgi:hypothetical protein